MKILVTGSSGLVGSALLTLLRARRHQVVRLVRRQPEARESAARWDPERGTVDSSALGGMDGAVHLAGENISGARWTPSRKARLRDSRVLGTRLLSETLARLAHPPPVLISASAMGYYGSRGEELLSEQSGPGTGFLPKLCQEWEAATEPARRRGIRVVNLRIGMVLARNGGALPRMIPFFNRGMGGRIGDGRQFVSWITIDDLASILLYSLVRDWLQGPVNAVTPNPVRNAEFTKALGKVLRRRAIIPIPAFAARLAFGEMADALLLASARIEPLSLLATGFNFQYPEIEEALRHVLMDEITIW